MPAVGMFPLSIVLLPTERLPLHIFEPRYRELIAECIDAEAEFGMVFEDESGTRDVGTFAGVDEIVHRFDDGRLNVVIAGRGRFRIAEWTSGRSFLTAEVEPFEDEDDPPGAGVAERAVNLFQRLAEHAGAEIEPPSAASPLLSFELAARVDFGAEVKQQLIESRSERERLAKVVGLLEREVQGLAIEREVTERASKNGKVFAPKD